MRRDRPALAGVSRSALPLAVLEPELSTLGLANRILAPFAKRAYLACRNGAALPRRQGPALPGLRPGLLACPVCVPASGRSASSSSAAARGALALNEVLPKALSARASLSPGYQRSRSRCSIRRAVIATPPCVRRMPGSQASRSCRSSGTSRTGSPLPIRHRALRRECRGRDPAIGRAGIFVPFPHAADDHQAKNALSLRVRGRGICIRQDAADGTRLATGSSRSSKTTGAASMADAAKSHNRPRGGGHRERTCALAGISLKKPPTPVPDERREQRIVALLGEEDQLIMFRTVAAPCLYFRGRRHQDGGLAEILRTMEFDVSALGR